ncbi:MAG TPA: DUF302 domain-containing protein [Candidatus Baltobacteraceae bacterium]
MTSAPNGPAGLTIVESPHHVPETVERLIGALEKAGNTIFARVDHAAGATAVGLSMKPMQLVLFGNPASGTPLMLAAPTFGIDLPMKILVWESESGVHIGTNSLAWLSERHGVATLLRQKLETMEMRLRELISSAL